MNTRQYSCETRIVSGLGVVSKIPEELERYDITQPALVVDSDIAKAGLLEKWLTKELLGIPTRIFAPVNPSIKDVESGVDDAKADDCDGVVIIGGGSTMCLGKAIAVMLTNEGQILDYEGNNRLKSVRPIKRPYLMKLWLMFIAAACANDLCPNDRWFRF
jgi:choline dehydrogenase